MRRCLEQIQSWIGTLVLVQTLHRIQTRFVGFPVSCQFQVQICPQSWSHCSKDLGFNLWLHVFWREKVRKFSQMKGFVLALNQSKLILSLLFSDWSKLRALTKIAQQLSITHATLHYLYSVFFYFQASMLLICEKHTFFLKFWKRNFKRKIDRQI